MGLLGALWNFFMKPKTEAVQIAKQAASQGQTLGTVENEDAHDKAQAVQADKAGDARTDAVAQQLRDPSTLRDDDGFRRPD